MRPLIIDQAPGKDSRDLEKQIDEMAYELYHITQAEQKIIKEQ